MVWQWCPIPKEGYGNRTGSDLRWAFYIVVIVPASYNIVGLCSPFLLPIRLPLCNTTVATVLRRCCLWLRGWTRSCRLHWDRPTLSDASTRTSKADCWVLSTTRVWLYVSTVYTYIFPLVPCPWCYTFYFLPIACLPLQGVLQGSSHSASYKCQGGRQACTCRVSRCSSVTESHFCRLVVLQHQFILVQYYYSTIVLLIF